MSTVRPRLLTRTTTRRVVRLVTTIREVYTYTPVPPRPVIETTGETVEELPPSQPGIRSARVATVHPLRRTGTR